MSDLLKLKILRIETDIKGLELLSTRISLASERLESMVSELTKIGLEQLHSQLGAA